MKQILKIIGALLIFAAVIVAFPLFLRQGSQGSEKFTIIATNFPAYDFARAVSKNTENTEVKMLISPGAEIHSFEPTPEDIKNIKESNLFIYTGGESDEWVENLLKDINPEKTKVVKMFDAVKLLEEETTEGMESEEEDEKEYDEHIWTSLKNATKIITKIKDELIKADAKNREKYEQNATSYINELNSLDQEIAKTVETAKRKELIFGDRFPLRYFVEDYGLKYYAAFPGCSEQTEASSKTIAFLIDKIKSDNVPAVFKIELSSGKIADELARATGATVYEFHSAHNISKDDFERGLTYLEIMKNNAETLKKALN